MIVFHNILSPVFGKQRGVTYVIPERKTFAQVFEQGAPAQAVATLESNTLAPKDVAQR